ncbi:HMG box-containing protein 4-like [Branchiostoma lanceolatum]|uniref:HMG box-containing protein 4-like n=1 Tax=Branchiostoma lanceolatum TaxID=7740 RepID=UPI003452DB90
MSARGQKRKPSRYQDYELETDYTPSSKRAHHEGEGGGPLLVASPSEEHWADSGRSPRVRKKSVKLRDSDREGLLQPHVTSPQKSSSSKSKRQDLHSLGAAHYSQDPPLYLSSAPASASSHKKDKGKHKKSSKLEPLYIDTSEMSEPRKHSKGSHHHHKHDKESKKSKKSHSSKDEDPLHSPDESDVHVEEMEGIKLKLILSPKERGAGSSEEKETKSKKSGSHKKDKEETSHKKEKKSKSKEHSASSEDGKSKKKEKKKKKEKHKPGEELSFESSMDESYAGVGASPPFSLPQFGSYGMGMEGEEMGAKEKMKITLKLGGSGPRKEEPVYSGGVPEFDDHQDPQPFEFPPYAVDDTEVSSQSDSALASPGETKQKQKKEKKEKKDKKKKEKAPKEDKKPRKKVMTAYMLWSKHQRQKVVEANPGIDFSSISKKLGEMWQQLPEKEKMIWRSKRLTLEHKQKKAAATTVKRKVTALSPVRGGAVSPEPVMSPVKTPVPGTSPIDVAAHLKLLGESLSLVGQRLHETEGHIAIHGGLSVLLDSMVCALGPLLSLTRQVPAINGCPQEVHERTLDNVAYIMPGL